MCDNIKNLYVKYSINTRFVIIIANPCYVDPCQNGATCSVGGIDYVCTCTDVWTGTTCSDRKYNGLDH